MVRTFQVHYLLSDRWVLSVQLSHR
jgi:hypothetical protein